MRLRTGYITQLATFLFRVECQQKSERMVVGRVLAAVSLMLAEVWARLRASWRHLGGTWGHISASGRCCLWEEMLPHVVENQHPELPAGDPTFGHSPPEKDWKAT